MNCVEVRDQAGGGVAEVVRSFPSHSEIDAACVRHMGKTLSYRHRVITDDDVVCIRRLIALHLHLSRWGLSRKLCAAWNWVQANGALRDMVCRGLLLLLHREGLIELFAGAPGAAQSAARAQRA